MNYALFYNAENDNIELYPQLETHNLSQKDIEKYLEELPNAKTWTIYDHIPNDNDIDEFENLIEDEIED